MLEVALKGLADWQRDRDRDFNLKMDDVIINRRNPVVGVCVCVPLFICFSTKGYSRNNQV